MIEKSLILYPKQAAEYLGVGKTKFYELSRLKGFPAPKCPTGKRKFYLREELEKWVKSL